MLAPDSRFFMLGCCLTLRRIYTSRFSQMPENDCASSSYLSSQPSQALEWGYQQSAHCQTQPHTTGHHYLRSNLLRVRFSPTAWYRLPLFIVAVSELRRSKSASTHVYCRSTQPPPGQSFLVGRSLSGPVVSRHVQNNYAFYEKDYYLPLLAVSVLFILLI